MRGGRAHARRMTEQVERKCTSCRLPFARLPACPFARSPVRSPAGSLVCPFARSLARLPVRPFARAAVRLLARLPARPPACLLVRPPVRSRSRACHLRARPKPLRPNLDRSPVRLPYLPILLCHLCSPPDGMSSRLPYADDFSLTVASTPYEQKLAQADRCVRLPCVTALTRVTRNVKVRVVAGALNSRVMSRDAEVQIAAW